MTQAMLEETLPGTAVKDISELINVGLDLTAANGTKIPFIGWAEWEYDFHHRQRRDKKFMFHFLLLLIV